MTKFVPADLTGLWRREVITTPAGYRDETTRVLWLQTCSWYADIRVPADRPTPAGATGFADFSDAELLQLAAIQGFAGQLSAADGVCLWRRDLDHQPPGDLLDEARFAVDGEVMIEDGIHADYQEIWRREAGSAGPLAAFQLTSDPAGRNGFLVIAGDHFIEFVDRPLPLPHGKSLAEIVGMALTTGRRSTAEQLLSTRISHGRIGDGWKVALSSLPWLEGAPLWPESPRFLADQGVLQTPHQTWTLLDSSLPATELTAWFAVDA